MTDDDWYELQQNELAECGYIPPLGHTYCRECGGEGGQDGIICVDCQGMGSFPHPEFDE